MKISYTGRKVELAPAQLKKLGAQFEKTAKMLDGRRECEAHVIVSMVRHLHHAEATVNYYGHQLAGLGSSSDLFAAIHSAAEKLEKQALKAKTKWRDTKRAPHADAESNGGAPAEETEPAAPRIYRVDDFQKSKPMTVDEALLEMDGNRDYMVYRNAETDRVSVLVRRRDGHFDLVEA